MAAHAQEIDEIMVTAEKHSQSVQSISSVVTAVSGEALAEQGVTDLRGIQNVAPNLKFSANGTATPIYLRGVGTENDATGSDPSITVNVDGVSLYRYALGGALFDLSRVEVLYGPQGTLYGRNSSAGVINFVTNSPTKDAGGYATVEYGDYNTIHTTAAINLPVSDTFALRVAINSLHHDGYTSTGQNGDSGVGGEDSIAGRVSGLWTPTENLSVLGKVEYWHGGGSSQIAVNYPFINPGNPWYTPFTRAQWDTWNDSHYYIADLNVTYDFGAGLSLNYIFGYLQNDANYTLANGGADALQTKVVPTTFVRRYYLPWVEFSNEFRLIKQADKYQWTLGLYQYDGNSNSDPGLAANTFPGVTGIPTARIAGSGYDHTVEKAYAIYGQGSYSILDNLRFILGARVSHDPKSEDFNSGFTFTAGAFNASGKDTTVPAGVHIIAHRADNDGDYKVGFEYDLKKDVMLYANVATGFLDGGIITQPAPGISPYFDPEHLRQYAIGIKSEWFDRRFLLNDELFYYDYRGLQLVTNVQDALTGLGVSGVVNAPHVVVYGDDLSLGFEIDADTSIGAKVGYLPRANLGAFHPLSGNYTGFRLPFAATLSGSLTGSHTFHLPNSATVKFNVESALSSSYWEVFTHVANTNEHSYTRTDSSLDYSPDSNKWTAGLWVKNIENGWQLAADSGNGVAIINPPRTFGVRATIKF